MFLERFIGVVLCIVGVGISILGIIFLFRTLRYLPLRRTVTYAFLGPLLLMSGLGVAILGLFMAGSGRFDYQNLGFLLFSLLGVLFGFASAVRESIRWSFKDALVRRGTLTRSQAYPYDKSPQ
jgi:uncharacterized membrane protein YidH (DUF202 family)